MTTAAPNLRNTTLAVLAGGEGVRMGRPKAFLEMCGQPILCWLLSRLDWPGPTILVTSKQFPKPPGAENFDLHVHDSVSGNGPLQGLLAALESCNTPQLAAITLDMPNIDCAKLAWLLDQLAPPMIGVMCRRTTELNQIEPFPSVFAASAVELVRSHLRADRRSMHGLCNEPTIQAIVAPDTWPAETWVNLNFPDELARFHSTLKSP